MAARLAGLVPLQRDNDADEDSNRGVETQDDHVDNQLHLLHPAGQHVGADTEHNRHRVEGDGPGQHPDSGDGLGLEADGHALEQAVDREGDHHEDGPQGAQDVAPLVPVRPVLGRSRRSRVRVGVKAGLGDAVDVGNT